MLSGQSHGNINSQHDTDKVLAPLQDNNNVLANIPSTLYSNILKANVLFLRLGIVHLSLLCRTHFNDHSRLLTMLRRGVEGGGFYILG